MQYKQSDDRLVPPPGEHDETYAMYLILPSEEDQATTTNSMYSTCGDIGKACMVFEISKWTYKRTNRQTHLSQYGTPHQEQSNNIAALIKNLRSNSSYWSQFITLYPKNTRLKSMKIKATMPNRTTPSRSSREKHFRNETARVTAVKLKENSFAA